MKLIFTDFEWTPIKTVELAMLFVVPNVGNTVVLESKVYYVDQVMFDYDTTEVLIALKDLRS